MASHIVRSEVLDELSVSALGAAASGRVLVQVNASRCADAREDADGDLDVPRKRRRRDADDSVADDVIVLETSEEGGADATGSQLWRASLLLAEYLLSERPSLGDATLLELGCGVGLVAVVAARVARLVFATDGDRDALVVCERNLTRNKCDPKRAVVCHLRWGCSGGEEDDCDVPDRLRWLDHSSERIDWIVASDVFYDDEVTDLFLDTLHALMQQHPHAKVVVAAEKRVVFSAVTLNEVSLGYDAFISRLCHHQSTCDDKLTSCLTTCTLCVDKSETPDSKARFVATPVPVDSVPRLYRYDRVSTLAMWQLYAVVAY